MLDDFLFVVGPEVDAVRKSHCNRPSLRGVRMDGHYSTARLLPRYLGRRVAALRRMSPTKSFSITCIQILPIRLAMVRPRNEASNASCLIKSPYRGRSNAARLF